MRKTVVRLESDTLEEFDRDLSLRDMRKEFLRLPTITHKYEARQCMNEDGAPSRKGMGVFATWCVRCADKAGRGRFRAVANASQPVPPPQHHPQGNIAV